MNPKNLVRTYKRRLLRWTHPISRRALRTTLRNLFLQKAEILLVHSSLSSCGLFLTAPQNVLGEIADYANTLALPTHTYCYPEHSNEAPLFDPKSTASHNGLLTEMFRKSLGTMRSIHATHSIAARGPLAPQLTAEHWRQNTPCGRGTPYAQLIERHASVLMFGVSFHSYTLFHTAEDAADSHFAYEENTIDRLRVVDEAGQTQTCLSKRQSRVPRRFAEVGEHLVGMGIVKKARLGRAYLYLAPDCAVVHDYLVQQIRKTPDFLCHNCSVKLDD